MDNSALSKCPICGNRTIFSQRYKDYVCSTCVSSGTYTKDNRKIEFYNIDPSGGFQSVIEGENKHGSEHECYIFKNGDKYHCYADEARFGGIVVRLIR